MTAKHKKEINAFSEVLRYQREIKELMEENHALRAKIANLERSNTDIRARNDSLHGQITGEARLRDQLKRVKELNDELRTENLRLRAAIV